MVGVGVVVGGGKEEWVGLVNAEVNGWRRDELRVKGVGEPSSLRARRRPRCGGNLLRRLGGRPGIDRAGTPERLGGLRLVVGLG